MLDTVGPLSMLPVLLAALGAIFTAAGVGDVISGLVSGVIPQGNAVVGVVVYAIGMAVFTMVMGNAYGAITVMTVGIGAPFVLSLGADPALIGSVALTCGFCGTLMTPMAANFNIVPGGDPGDEGLLRRHQEAGADRAVHARGADRLHDRLRPVAGGAPRGAS